jgi:hypothetical protein
VLKLIDAGRVEGGAPGQWPAAVSWLRQGQAEPSDVLFVHSVGLVAMQSSLWRTGGGGQIVLR